MPFDFEDLGEQSFKNMAESVQVYRITAPTSKGQAKSNDAVPAARPSIAVMPFINLSADGEQEYFADGLTEDVITELSRFKRLQVAARNSSFHIKGKAPKVTEAGRELGVSHILEGSVRKTGNRVRITAQLIETTGGSHFWAERYDRDLADIFAVQDELISAIVSTLEGWMMVAGAATAQRKPTQSSSAYDFFLRGRGLANAHSESEAEPFFAQAVAIDPGFAQAHAWRSVALSVAYMFDFDPEALEKARQTAETAIALDNGDANAHHAMAMVALYSRDFGHAEFHFHRAVTLNSVDVSICGDRANWLCYAGRLEEAWQTVNDAIQRDAFAPIWLRGVRGKILFDMHRYQEAANSFMGIPTVGDWVHVYYVATLAKLPDITGAARELNRIRTRFPDCSVSALTSWLPYSDPAPLEPLREGLRQAGLKD
jgi:adenylate cyclase